MSRTGSPALPGALFSALLGASAALATAGSAVAADKVLGGGGRGREGSAATVLGAPNATACTQFVNKGRSDDAALEACNLAINTEDLNRNNMIITLINRGALHLRRNDGAAALADFDAVLARDPRHSEAMVNRGAALILSRKHGEAVAAITQALGMGVSQPHKAYLNRGVAREGLGDVRGAHEDYSTALEIKPDWGPAERELARFAQGRRDVLAIRIQEEDAEDAAAAATAGAPQPASPASPSPLSPSATNPAVKRP